MLHMLDLLVCDILFPLHVTSSEHRLSFREYHIDRHTYIVVAYVFFA